jgi:hypothetical protein
VPVIQVRWEWLALLACQVLLTVVVLVSTIRMTHSSGIQGLRDSSITTVCTLEQSTREALGQFDDPEMRNKKAREVKVILEPDVSGALSLVERSSFEFKQKQQDI